MRAPNGIAGSRALLARAISRASCPRFARMWVAYLLAALLPGPYWSSRHGRPDPSGPHVGLVASLALRFAVVHVSPKAIIETDAAAILPARAASVGLQEGSASETKMFHVKHRALLPRSTRFQQQREGSRSTGRGLAPRVLEPRTSDTGCGCTARKEGAACAAPSF